MNVCYAYEKCSSRHDVRSISDRRHGISFIRYTLDRPSFDFIFCLFSISEINLMLSYIDQLLEKGSIHIFCLRTLFIFELFVCIFSLERKNVISGKQRSRSKKKLVATVLTACKFKEYLF